MFDECWAAYPHCKHPPRSKKALSRALFNEITTRGFECIVDGLRLSLKATPEEIFSAVKIYAERVDKDYEVGVKENRQFVPGFQVYLRQGRFEDEETTEEII